MMKFFIALITVFIPACFVSCYGSSKKAATEQSIEKDASTDEVLTKNDKSIDLIKSVYDIFVFAIDADGDNIHHPEKYFTAHALKKLREDFEFDCEDEPCYAYYALRTDAHDSKPGSDGIFLIYNIEPIEDEWYMVSYSDMGWHGKTLIKISDGRIDDYKRQVDNESNRD